MISKISGRFNMSRRLLVIIIVVLVAAAAFGALELTGTTHVFNKKPVAVAAGSDYNTKGQKKSDNKSSDSASGDNSPGNSSYNSDQKLGGSSAVLTAPSGNFVSNHRPNLSGSPAPNTEISVCNTTPGATCKITFTNGGTVKALPNQIADPNGSVYWNWRLQDVGLSVGTWKVQASASLSGQTKSSFDAMDLVVAQ